MTFDAAISIQMAASAVVILLFVFFSVSAQAPRGLDYHPNTCQMLLLVSFLFRTHPRVKKIEDLTSNQETSESEQLRRYLDHFCQEAAIPTYESPKWSFTGVVRAVIRMLLAPFFPLSMAWQLLRGQACTVRHTVLREAYVGQIAPVLLMNILFLFATFHYRTEFPLTLIHIAFILALFGVLLSLYIWVRLIVDQSWWKTYWSERLFEVTLKAEQDHDCGLLSCSLELRTLVEAQPVFLMPGSVVIYTTLFTVTQAVPWILQAVAIAT